jgi:hypothetical protein
MGGFLKDFLSFGSGALAAQALYFLFVKYPYELRRHDDAQRVTEEQIELTSKSWKRTFDTFFEAYKFVSELLIHWNALGSFEERERKWREVDERLWTIKALYRIDGEPMARMLELFEGVLGDISRALLKEEEPTTEERDALMRHLGAVKTSARAIQDVESSKSLQDKAAIGGSKNEQISLKRLCLWSRVGLFVYGMLVAMASAMIVFRSGLAFHTALTCVDAIFFVALTMGVLWYSYSQERNLRALTIMNNGEKNA